ncbi:VOC family protein [Streptomyces sp. NPDC047976]|uniref:VOC family protein n=1 Tax=Streptomyces sp. NPDC047976 TaxID=3155746 RepID=UPI0034463211
MEGAVTRRGASDAVGDQGWRLLLGTLRTSVPVGSLAVAAEVAAAAVAACGDDADGHLHVDLRPRKAVLTLRSSAHAEVTAVDIGLAHRISAAVRARGLRTEPDVGTGAPRSVQLLEIAIDALDIAAIRPFWRAVLGYAGEAGTDGPRDPLVDPLGQGPGVWFQQMELARPQRNRIHLDVSTPHDEAPRRVEAALAAGGRLVSAARAPAFWVLADPEGNEACVSTWQGRDG